MFNVPPDLARSYLVMTDAVDFFKRLERLHVYITETFMPKYKELAHDTDVNHQGEIIVLLSQLNHQLMYDGKETMSLWPLCHRVAPRTQLAAYTRALADMDYNQINLEVLYKFVWEVYFPHLPFEDVIGCLVRHGTTCDHPLAFYVISRFAYLLTVAETQNRLELPV